MIFYGFFFWGGAMSSGLKLLLVFGYHFPLFSAIGLIGFMAHYDFEVVRNNFKKSIAIVEYSEGSEDASFFQRFSLMTIIVGVIATPTLHIRRGHLDPEEMHCLPLPTRRRMRWAFALMMMVLFWLVLVFIYSKFIY